MANCTGKARMRILGLVTTCQPRRPSHLRTKMPALLLGGACLLSPLSAALADDTAADLKELRAAIQKELADLKKREQKLHQEFLRLDQKSQLLDEQLRKLRAAGAGAPVIATPTPTAAVTPSRPATTEVAQTNAPSPAPQPAPESNAPAPPPPTGAESAPISGPSAEEQQARQVVETARHCRASVAS